MKSRLGFVSNSSSSSFICYNSDISVEQAEEILRELLDFYDRFINEPTGCGGVIYEDVFHVEKSSGVGYDKAGAGVKDIYVHPAGALVIKSASDNSIPYLLTDWIEERFNARRIEGI